MIYQFLVFVSLAFVTNSMKVSDFFNEVVEEAHKTLDDGNLNVAVDNLPKVLYDETVDETPVSGEQLFNNYKACITARIDADTLPTNVGSGANLKNIQFIKDMVWSDAQDTDLGSFQANGKSQTHKFWICHGTSSGNNTHTDNVVDYNSLMKTEGAGGHFKNGFNHSGHTYFDHLVQGDATNTLCGCPGGSGSTGGSQDAAYVLADTPCGLVGVWHNGQKVFRSVDDVFYESVPTKSPQWKKVDQPDDLQPLALDASIGPNNNDDIKWTRTEDGITYVSDAGTMSWPYCCACA